MPLWIGDYLADTKRLTLEQHGAYLLLLMDYWRNGAPPDDDATLARILGVDLKNWRKIRPVLASFFTLDQGRWQHRRVEAELAGARERSGKAAAKAKLAATRRWERERGQAAGSIGDAPSNAPSMPDAMLQAMLEDMPQPCPPPVTYSVPSEQAQSAPPDPNKEAWRRAVAVLATAGMTAPKARTFFGKLLRDNALEARDLLPSVVKVEGLGTEDPQGYLTKAARAVATRRGATTTPPAPAMEEWDADRWRTALRLYRQDGTWSPDWGPQPGQLGCRAPADLLAPTLRVVEGDAA
jgi:uncharacterized protein YdaU (DUF1376 family)